MVVPNDNPIPIKQSISNIAIPDPALTSDNASCSEARSALKAAMIPNTTYNLGYLDLFSGIGGHALALRGLAEPLAFCEIDKRARAVLRLRFPSTPIADDVRSLSITDNVEPILPSHIMTPDTVVAASAIAGARLVTASFPCQDISSAGLRRGIFEGTRSGLVWEVFRVIDTRCPSVEAVFLENSTALRRHGLPDITSAFEERGFRVAWGDLSASSLGARHRRSRIWVLALRGQMLERELSEDALRASAVLALSFPFQQLEREVPRLAAKIPRSPVGVRRWNSLGNAVVPSVARLAFAVILSNMRTHRLVGDLGLLQLRVPTSWSIKMPLHHSYVYPVLDLPCITPAPGCPLVLGEADEEECPMVPGEADEGECPMVPGEADEGECPMVPGEADEGECPIPRGRIRLWLTPIYNSRHFWPNRVFGPSIRSATMFATRVFYEYSTCRAFGFERTDVARVRKALELNPRWIEALMGFPDDWTRV